MTVVNDLLVSGVFRTDEVAFGQVITSPLPPCSPIAVAQPQDGCTVVADPGSRYEFELFSGACTLQCLSFPRVSAGLSV